MISKERLEELIEQGATIWSCGWLEEIELNKDTCIIKDVYKNGELNGTRLFVSEDENHCPAYNIENLEEDVETAKFKLKYQNITRTETLSLPTYWEAMPQSEDAKTVAEFDNYRLLVCDCGFGWIGIDVDGNTEIYHWEGVTKENYLQACEICRKLFLGESV